MNSNLFSKRLLRRSKDELALRRILGCSEGSEYGGRYGVSKDLDVRNFKIKVPIITYKDLKPYIERAFRGERFVLSNENIEMWATTSGTTSVPKLIPYTKTFIRNYRVAERRFFVNIFRRFPSILAGNILIITGRKCNYISPTGLSVGSASGLMAANIPSIFKKLIVGDPEELDAIDDDHRLSYLSQKAMDHDIRLITGSSTFLLSLLEKIVERVGVNGIRKIWPKLKLICCPCGGYSRFQVEGIRAILPWVEIWDTGFGASEGFLSTTARCNEPLGIPNSDLYFFELTPLDHVCARNETISIDKAQLGRPYELIVSAANGLLRYRMKDIVSFDKVRGKKLIRYMGRTNLEVSVQGEKLTENQVIEATKTAQTQLGFDFSSFLFVPPKKKVEGVPYSYFLIMTTKNNVSDRSQWVRLQEEFEQLLDSNLREANINYRNAREISNRLDPIEIVILKGTDFTGIKRRVRRYSPFYGQGKESCLFDVQEDDFYERIRICYNDSLVFRDNNRRSSGVF